MSQSRDGPGVGEREDRVLHLLAVDVVARERGEEVVGLVEAGLRGDGVELERRAAEPRELEQLVDHLREPLARARGALEILAGHRIEVRPGGFSE